MDNKPLTIADYTIQPGEQKMLELITPSLYSQTPMNVPVHVFHGKKAGPRVFVLAAVHGDEIDGVEIIRRLLRHASLKHLRGTLIAVPVVNVYGFIILSRYLPDRRDLNRSFPGSKTGSLTGRLAYLFMNEIISQCTHGIDLHTGNIHSENLPHIRTNLDMPGALILAKAFNTPVIIDARLRDGSLRQAATELDIPVLVYEGGEALRFNELAIRVGLRGVLNVLHTLGMIELPIKKNLKIKSAIARASYWARSPKSGIFYQLRKLGNDIVKGEKIGIIVDPFTKRETEIFSPIGGIIIGRNTLPLVNEGDPLFHVAKLRGTDKVLSHINHLQLDLPNDPFAFE